MSAPLNSLAKTAPTHGEMGTWPKKKTAAERQREAVERLYGGLGSQLPPTHSRNSHHAFKGKDVKQVQTNPVPASVTQQVLTPMQQESPVLTASTAASSTESSAPPTPRDVPVRRHLNSFPVWSDDEEFTLNDKENEEMELMGEEINVVQKMIKNAIEDLDVKLTTPRHFVPPNRSRDRRPPIRAHKRLPVSKPIELTVNLKVSKEPRSCCSAFWETVWEFLKIISPMGN